MKALFLIIVSLFVTSVLADECSPDGVARAEQGVLESVERKFGPGIEVRMATEASVSNVYSEEMICHYVTLYTFTAIDPYSGITSDYIGSSIVDNDGMRPKPSTLLIQQSL